jgi:hypothetical protein
LALEQYFTGWAGECGALEYTMEQTYSDAWISYIDYGWAWLEDGVFYYQTDNTG